VEDDEQNIWVATSYGIAHLLIRDGKVYHIEPYINQDNIPNESFVNGRALKLNDGRIVMQSIDHIVVFDPHFFLNGKMASIKIFPQLIKIAVIGYDIEAGKELDGKVITEKAVASTDAITVNYNQNSVALQFSALNYVRPVQTYYRVRIKGVPEYEKWKILSYGKSQGMVDKYGQLRLPLLGLRPGTYQIEMQASLWPETWTEEPSVWTIHVEQPWWRTTGLYVALTILIVLLLLLNFTLFYRNTHWRMIRNNEEADIRRNIRSFVSRCESLSTEIVTPQSMPKSEEGQSHMRMNDIFVRTMLRIVPFVQQQKDQTFTMEQLAEVAEVDTSDLYKLFSAHLDLNPRIIMMPLRLQEAAQQLTNMQLSIDEVAKKCRFSSTNFFIASFFHYYRQTPEAYRSTMPR
jgi:AraC-like DNA-binding protein